MGKSAAGEERKRAKQKEERERERVGGGRGRAGHRVRGRGPGRHWRRAARARKHARTPVVPLVEAPRLVVGDIVLEA